MNVRIDLCHLVVERTCMFVVFYSSISKFMDGVFVGRRMMWLFE